MCEVLTRQGGITLIKHTVRYRDIDRNIKEDVINKYLD